MCSVVPTGLGWFGVVPWNPGLREASSWAILRRPLRDSACGLPPGLVPCGTGRPCLGCQPVPKAWPAMAPRWPALRQALGSQERSRRPFFPHWCLPRGRRSGRARAGAGSPSETVRAPRVHILADSKGVVQQACGHAFFHLLWHYQQPQMRRTCPFAFNRGVRTHSPDERKFHRGWEKKRYGRSHRPSGENGLWRG